MTNTMQKIQALGDTCSGDTEFQQMLGKIVDVRLSRYRRKLSRYTRELEDWEQKYGMDSQEFYERFKNGELGDEMDFFEWAGLVELRNDLQEKIQRLEAAR